MHTFKMSSNQLTGNVCLKCLSSEIDIVYFKGLSLFFFTGYYFVMISRLPNGACVSSAVSYITAMMLHSENMFPLVESGGFSGSSLPLSVLTMPSGLQLQVNVLVTDDTFMYCENMYFIVLAVTPPDPSCLMTCSHFPQHLWQLEPARVKVLIQNCYTSNTLFSVKSVLFIPQKNHQTPGALLSLVQQETCGVSGVNC